MPASQIPDDSSGRRFLTPEAMTDSSPNGFPMIIDPPPSPEVLTCELSDHERACSRLETHPCQHGIVEWARCPTCDIYFAWWDGCGEVCACLAAVLAHRYWLADPPWYLTWEAI